MFDRPPTEREAISWGYAVFWAGLTFATVPFVRVGVKFARENLGPGFFTYTVVALVVLAAASALYKTRQRLTLWSCMWLSGLSGLVIYFVFGLASGNAVEAVHFIQYGTLSLLLFRAFSHRVRDYSVYAAAAIAGSFAGMIDETIQWLVPGRVFDLRDVWLNAEAVTIVQIGIAAGIRPRYISVLPGWQSMKRLCYLSATAIGYLGLCLQNTPDRVSWYSANVPGLGFIDPSRNIMVEYGHLHGDADTVVFRSRLTSDELSKAAAGHSGLGAPNLDVVHERESQEDFRFRDTLLTNPFLYEGRLHQLRRDQNLGRATSTDADDKQARHFAAAHWENVILEDHFSEVLTGTRYEWSREMASSVRDDANLAKKYESSVSEHLIVAYNPHQLAILCATTVAMLLFLAYVCGRAVRPVAKS